MRIRRARSVSRRRLPASERASPVEFRFCSPPSRELPVELYGDFIHWFVPHSLSPEPRLPDATAASGRQWATQLWLSPGSTPTSSAPSMAAGTSMPTIRVRAPARPACAITCWSSTAVTSQCCIHHVRRFCIASPMADFLCARVCGADTVRACSFTSMTAPARCAAASFVTSHSPTNPSTCFHRRARSLWAPHRVSVCPR